MQLIKEFLDLMLHLQDHLHDFTRQYGLLVYALLFLIVFCETGLVVFGIIGVSLLPMVIEVARARFGRQRESVVSPD